MGRPRFRVSRAVEKYIPEMIEHLRVCVVCREALLIHMFECEEAKK